MVKPENDPDQPKTEWSYDPHLDPALQFDIGRAQIERLIDDALGSGETSRQGQWRDELIKTDIRGKGGDMLKFAELETVAGLRHIHAANVFERRDEVVAYAKNERLGFQVYYMWNASKRRYVPDFFVKLTNGRMLVLEIKGQDSDKTGQNVRR